MLTLFVVALGSFFVTELFKNVVPWLLHAWTKMAIVLIVALAISAVLAEGWAEAVSVALGGSAGAGLLHKTHRLVGALGDVQRIAVLKSGLRRR